MRRPLAVVVAALALPAAPALAQTTYTARASFLAALASTETVDVEGLVDPSGFAVLGGTGLDLTLGSLTFGTTSSFSSFFAIGPDYAGGAFLLGSGAVLSPQVLLDANDLVVTFASGVRAFGFDFGFGDGARTLTVALAGGATYSVTYGGTLPTPGFFGFIADAPLASVTITADNDVAIYDNFTIGTPLPTNVVPEPATVALLGGGLAVVGLAAARRRVATR